MLNNDRITKVTALMMFLSYMDCMCDVAIIRKVVFTTAMEFDATIDITIGFSEVSGLIIVNAYVPLHIHTAHC